MLSFFLSVFESTNWSFVLRSSLISMVVGALWYSKVLFWKKYAKRMYFPKDFIEARGEYKNQSMWPSFIAEIISRVLYFVWLWWVLITWGRLDFLWALSVSLLIWLVFLFSTILSAVYWSLSNKKVIWIIAWKALVESVIVTYIFTLLV